MASDGADRRIPAGSVELPWPAVVVDVVGRTRYAPAERADDRLEPIGDGARGGMAPPEPLGGHLGLGAQRAPVDREDLAGVNHQLAVDHHLVDGRAVFG